MLLNLQVADQPTGRLLEQFPATLRRGIERGLRRATQHLQRAVAEKAQSPLGTRSPTAYGELVRSLASAVIEEDGRQVGSLFLAPPADRYGLFVEVGTRPHFPPPAALEGWVRRRLGIAGDREVREVAFLIGRKIARAGTPGRFFFERTLRENEDKVVAILEEEIGKALS